ncbi:MAG: LysO family transporter [Tannerellaceae bacterium]|nr:LysO family transporter [Tannerellaceae bacterium]
MFTVIASMFIGVLTGYLFRNVEFLQRISASISWTIFLLLFLLGISVGSNRMIIQNLSSLGQEAFLLAFAGTLGSILAAWFVYRIFFKAGAKP